MHEEAFVKITANYIFNLVIIIGASYFFYVIKHHKEDIDDIAKMVNDLRNDFTKLLVDFAALRQSHEDEVCRKAKKNN